MVEARKARDRNRRGEARDVVEGRVAVGPLVLVRRVTFVGGTSGAVRIPQVEVILTAGAEDVVVGDGADEARQLGIVRDEHPHGCVTGVRDVEVVTGRQRDCRQVGLPEIHPDLIVGALPVLPLVVERCIVLIESVALHLEYARENARCRRSVSDSECTEEEQQGNHPECSGGS